MKKILLTTIFFLSLSVVVVAQKQQAKKPVATTATSKKKARSTDQTPSDKNLKLQKQAADAERLKALQTAKSLDVSNGL